MIFAQEDGRESGKDGWWKVFDPKPSTEQTMRSFSTV